jgi:predicted DNA-binding protein
MEHRMPQYSGTREEILQEICSKHRYMLIKRIANGGNGTIDFAIAKENVKKWRAGQYNSLSTDEIRKDLVAVKFPFGHQ